MLLRNKIRIIKSSKVIWLIIKNANKIIFNYKNKKILHKENKFKTKIIIKVT